MKEIHLTRGKVALVDDEDYEWLIEWNWHASPAGKGGNFYAERKKTSGGIKTFKMHREIMSPPKGMIIDHVDGNGLNNQRSNLRICKYYQNSMNRKPRHGGYKGVTLDKARNKYVPGLKIGGKYKRFGAFSTAEEAARVYDKEAKKLHGEFAWLNFPDE